MNICGVSGCKERVELSCSCDKRVRSCKMHYMTHINFEDRTTHTTIVIEKKNQEANKRAFNEHQCNSKLINTILFRGNQMISILQSRVDNTVRQITQRNREIYAMVDTGEFEGVEMKLGEANLEEFSELSKEFFQILVNPRKLFTGEENSIESLRNQTERIQGRIFSHSKTQNSDTASRKSSINLDSSTNVGAKGLPPLREQSSDGYPCHRTDHVNKEYHFTDKSQEEQKIKDHYPNSQPRCNIKRPSSVNAPNSPRSHCSDISKQDQDSLKFCMRCKSSDRVYLKSCMHAYCNKCILFKCSFCINRNNLLKCETCSNSSLENIELICKHIQCFTCVNNNVPCNKCNKFVCEKCEKMCPKLSEKECKHKICTDCFDEEKASGVCGLCIKVGCAICKEVNYEKIRFTCGHNGCRFCYIAGLSCFRCAFEVKKKALENGAPRYCFKCEGNKHCKQLICKDFVCMDCLKEVDMVDFNYCCKTCCSDKEKICINCGKPCGWRIDGNYFHKNCCGTDFCRKCLKKKGFFGLGCKFGG